MLLIGKTDISELCRSDVDKLQYFPIAQEDEWKLEIITILLEEQESSGLDEDSSDWLKILCTN